MTNGVGYLQAEKVYSSAKMELYCMEHRTLKIVLKGFQTVAEAARNGMALGHVANDKQIQYLLVDERSLRALSDDMKAFMVKSIDELANTGIKKVAILSAENIIARFGMEQVYSGTNHNVNYERELFDSESSALDWLHA